MEYRITTQEIILRQYVVTAETQAEALDRYPERARMGWTEDGPVTTHPERMVHIEEEPEELARREREGSEYEPLNWPPARCPVCQVTKGTRCRHPNGYTCAQPHDERPSAWDGPGLDCCERCDHPTQEIGRHRPNGPIVPLCSECQELERVNWDGPND